MKRNAALEAAEQRLALGVGRLLKNRTRGELHGAVDDGVGSDDGERLCTTFFFV